MKLLVVLALAALVSAAPQLQRTQRQSQNPQEVQLLRFENDLGITSWSHAFEQSDGQIHQEQGELKNAGTDDEAISVKGSYSWVGPDGVTYTVTYIADENGFQPTIEQGPGGGVPPAVVASLLG